MINDSHQDDLLRPRSTPYTQSIARRIYSSTNNELWPDKCISEIPERSVAAVTRLETGNRLTNSNMSYLCLHRVCSLVEAGSAEPRLGIKMVRGNNLFLLLSDDLTASSIFSYRLSDCVEYLEVVFGPCRVSFGRWLCIIGSENTMTE